MVAPAEPEVRDFSRRRKVRFRINHADETPEYFDGVPGLPAETLAEFAGMIEQLGPNNSITEQTKLFRDIFTLVLTDDSAKRFIDRMSNKLDPIDIDQVNDVMPWVMEQYGMRPTKPSSESSNGSANPDAGKNSTDVVLPSGLMFEPSRQTVS